MVATEACFPSILQAYHAYGIPGRQMLRAGNMVAGKKLLGHFKCDLGTVYTASGKTTAKFQLFNLVQAVSCHSRAPHIFFFYISLIVFR